MSLVNQAATARVAAVDIPDDIFAEAFQAALKAAERFARRRPGSDDFVFVDAATNAVMWSRDNCTDVTKFAQFAARAVKTWLCRTSAKRRERLANRPDTVELCPTLAASRTQAPVRPLVIDDLPEDLAFVVRLYTVDGYSLRDIGLLVGKSPNTIDLMLKRAAELLAPGRVKPERRKGERRLGQARAARPEIRAD